MRFLKAVVNMKAGTTDVVNILYYGADVNLPTAYTAGEMQQLGEAVLAAYNTSLLPHLPNGVVVDAVNVSQVNEENTATGVNTVIVGGGGGVGTGGDSDGRAVAVPVSFLMERVLDVNPLRVPKRSYIAHGPLTSSAVTPDGDFSPHMAHRAAIVAVFSQGHLINAASFEPYRIGTTNGGILPAVGRVIGVRIARRITVRRSRLDR